MVATLLDGGKTMLDFDFLNKDKNLFAFNDLPIVTVYDDNLFVRNDYDVLSVGQRNYLIQFFSKLGFKQTSGRLLTKGEVKIHLPRPNANLAVSSFESFYLELDGINYYALTPTQTAEVMFHYSLNKPDFELEAGLHKLINKCPFNIEWLRDVSYRSDIEAVTAMMFSSLMEYQTQVIKDKFKMKKAL